MITIKTFPAKAGDCFLISIEGKNKTNILIDGGFKSTASDFLIPELQKLAAVGEVLDLVIATHSDLDHIGGLIHFFKANGKSDSPKIIRVKEVWFNGYKHLEKSSIDRELSEEQKETLKELIADCKKYIKPESEDQLISLEKAASMAKVLSENGYSWNGVSGGKAIKIETLSRFEINTEVILRVISPSEPKLNELANDWQDELISRGLGEKPLPSSDLIEDALEVWEMAIGENEFVEGPISTTSDFETFLQQEQNQKFKEDDSPANGSSIAVVIESRGKNLLFSGDAHPSQLVAGLKSVYGDSIPNFDFVKLPHHGAFGCNSKELIGVAQSKAYLISTNGQHDGYTHPSWAAIAHIVLRENEVPSKLIFNYKENPVFVKLSGNQEFLKSRTTELEVSESPFEIVI